jgi:hypothetical protein
VQFDVFNGDADGICSLLQLRLEDPVESQLVTGIKRDIALLERVAAQEGDYVTVLDLSMVQNRDALNRLLSAGVNVDYVDHHAAGDIPDHANLTTTISEAPEVCTALLINGRLRGAQVAWAITGAFGDNLDEPASQVARKAGLSERDTSQLRELGICLNYNGYGPSLEDLHFHPADLYGALYEARSPAAFAVSDAFRKLQDGYCEDVAASEALTPLHVQTGFAVYHLPNAPWARRVSGVFSNDLVRAYPQRAHAVLTEQEDGAFLVSVRAPFQRRTGAEAVCSQFETGGGRAAAAGINRLPAADVDRLAAALAAEYGDQS